MSDREPTGALALSSPGGVAAQLLTLPTRTPSAIDRHIGARLRTARQAADLTLVDMSKQAGLSSQQIQKYETGDSRITAARLYQFATVLGRPVEWFFEGE